MSVGTKESMIQAGTELPVSDVLEEIRCKDDDWTGKTDPAERRKRQNRLHQRAWRRRQRELRDAATAQSHIREEDAKGSSTASDSLDDTFLLRETAWKHVSGLQRLLVTDEVERPPHDSQELWTTLATLPEAQATYAYWAELMVRRKSQIATTLLLQHPSLALRLSKPRNDKLTKSIPSLQTLLSPDSDLDILSDLDTWKFMFPLSADHQLFSLTQYNALRGIMTNMSILLNFKNSPRPFEGWSNFYTEDLSIRPENAPPSLIPTHMQKTVVHESWIDIVPAPAMRDNIIKYQDLINLDDLCADFLGAVELDLQTENHDNIPTPELSPNNSDSSSASLSTPVSDAKSSAGAMSLNASQSLDSPSRSRGMILWGDPWLTSGWEVDEIFVRKWYPLFEGCEAWIDSSSRWRQARGEEKIRLLPST